MMKWFGQQEAKAEAASLLDSRLQPPTHTGQQAAAKAFDASDYPREGTFSICCCFFLFLLVVPVSIVSLYHVFPTTILTLVGLWVFITLSHWAFHAGHAVMASDLTGAMLTVTLFVSVILAALNGVRCYYQHSQPLRQLAMSREYKGVYPELPAIVFPDAAYLEFAGNATVDVSKVASYQSLDSGLSTFCVAPIVSAATHGRHEFWAVGVDCCGDHGEKFECYDAGKPGVKTGWVLPQNKGDALFSTLGIYITPPEQRRDLFEKAVQKAEAVHGIASPGEHAIFVHWTKDKKADILFWQAVGVAVTVVFSAIWQTFVSLLLTRLYQRFQTLKKIHRIQQQGGLQVDVASSTNDHISGRLHQFMSASLDGASGSDMHGTINRVVGFKKEQLEKFRPPLSAGDMCLMGVLVPYVVLMLCVIISTFSPCARFGNLILAPFWCMTFIYILALLATPNRAVTGLFMMLCCTAGYYIGNANYKQNMFHYCSTSDRRVYSDVLADSSTDIYWDAGEIHFDQSARLSTTHAVGFKYEGSAYCVAPVISKIAPCKDRVTQQALLGTSNTSLLQADANHILKLAARKEKHPPTLVENEMANSSRPLSPPSFLQLRGARQHRKIHRDDAGLENMRMETGCARPAPTQVEFWAIGVDCCDARKRFWCDGGEVKDAHQAVIVRAFGDEKSEGPKIKTDRQHFFQAIDQAVAAYELPIPERPVLLRWGSSSKQLQTDWWERGMDIILMTALISLFTILSISLTSFWFMRRERQREKKQMEEYEKRESHGSAGNGGE